jgi:hypothetical protein
VWVFSVDCAKISVVQISRLNVKNSFFIVFQNFVFFTDAKK